VIIRASLSASRGIPNYGRYIAEKLDFTGFQGDGLAAPEYHAGVN
jgi:hypothetical protein